MAITDEGTGMVMPVAPMGNAYNNGGFGFGGDWAWILLLLVLGGGWGGFGGFGGAGAMMGAGMMDGFGLYPWLNNSQNINDGFRDQMLGTQINGIQNAITAGFGDVQLGIAGVNQNICQTGNGIVNALTSGFNTAEVSANARAMANMQQIFGVTTGIGDLKYTVAQENCLDRQAVSDGVRDILANQTASVQKILDKLCDQELQAERRENANLRSELQYARGQASQVEQTARILAGQTAEVDALYNRLSNCPVPSTPVYGRQPIFTCNGNGYACGGVA